MIESQNVTEYIYKIQYYTNMFDDVLKVDAH